MSRRSKVRGAAGAVTAGALALVALQGSSADAGDEKPSAAHPKVCIGTRPVKSLPGPGPEPSLYRVMDYVERTAKAHYPTVFTGLSVDDAEQATDVYRIPSKAFDADICGHAEKGVTIRLHDTDVAKPELDAVVDHISADMDRWDGTFELREVGEDSTGFVIVGVDDPAKAEPVIKKAYGEFGRKHIKVQHVEQASAD
ncbi:hypothetical protein [Streptomyces sp. NPDC001530]|uniref:hypothetical protein n=1 Tax=Streptomyces sp. NPDC001530 TaxID=3364582 RepID=UPI0036B9BBC3